MRAQEFLSELFDPNKALPYKWEHAHRARAALPDGRALIVNFLPQENKMFAIEFSVGDDFEMTGGGEVSTIFATVIAVVKQFIQFESRHLTALYFTAEEQSRAKMYDTLAKRVAKQVGWHVIPYDEMVQDEKYKTPLSFGDFLFALEPGTAPEHRQAAQKPQHGEFMPIWYVYSVEDKTAPVIKIKAKKSIDAEYYVRKTVPEYKTLDRMGIGTGKAPPGWGDITDMGTVKYPPKPTPRVMNPLEKALYDKLNAK